MQEERFLMSLGKLRCTKFVNRKHKEIGSVPPLPKTDKLIEDAVAWVVTTDEGKALQEAQDASTEAQTAPRTIAQIHICS